MSEFKITHSPEGRRFEIWDGNSAGYVEYEIHDGGLDILHTVVPFHMEGKGVGSALVKAAYDWARTEGLSPVATCRFARIWLERNPAYS
ncbi:MAG: N-acetyltransferase [Alistipes sp.]|jgi:predicted GNAT family acetyltransferase|nr:N-acetyltransferase [Alistipes sp.]